MRALVWVLLGLGFGCTTEKQGKDDPASSGGASGAGEGGSTARAGSTSAGVGGRAGGNGVGGSAGKSTVAGSGGAEDGGAAGDAGAAASSGQGGTNAEPVPLPDGSREVDGIVNLVDAAAAQELATFLTVSTPTFVTLRQDLMLSFNRFVEHYLEDYDFIFFYPDYTVENAYAAGIFQAVNRPAQPGGTSEIEIALGGYRTNGRTKGVIALNYAPGFYGPLAHEVLHYWANDLDARFGFGMGRDEDFGPHWGFSDVNGQLGGFDGNTLRCETPAGASPPGCTAGAGGTTRFVVGAFTPFTNTFRNVPYSPLELYLMGLAPAAEVPASFHVLTNATIVEPHTDVNGTAIVEADGMEIIPFAAILERHGEVPLLAASERAFRSAFVVISASPASDEVMNDVAAYAAAFGNRAETAEWLSFETHTQGRATMTTTLGARRDVSMAVPPVRAVHECDVLTQDCGRPELGCHLYPPAFCALNGDVALDEPCDAAFECAPGLDCVSGASAPDSYVCKPYCDPVDHAAADSCQNLCPGNFLEFRSTQGDVLGGLCVPE